ncbi:hypothetical protein OG241_28310 [Streptomyces sp. NBC_01390]|uniref:hypothetical protein n=1 Tax=Streptomyces sp. NBC_01390 TaxID=2903850 RepID=UPI0032506C29
MDAMDEAEALASSHPWPPVLLPVRLKTEPFRHLGSLGLPSEDFVVAGSAPLFIRGLRDRVTDLDIVVRGAGWRRAEVLGDVRRAPYEQVLAVNVAEAGSRIEILDGWFPHMFGSVDQLIARAEVDDDSGLRFLSLADTVRWKRHLDRQKDREDLRRIEAAAYRDPVRP